jgi:hypothetical protein
MSARDRLRRPSLDRSAPLRRASTLFEPASADGENAGATEGLAGVMSRSVELGYRVVDEYIRQGRRAAERLRSRSFSVESVQSDVQDASMRVAQYASEFASVWMDMLRVAAGAGAPRGSASQATHPFSGERPEPECSPAHGEATSVTSQSRARIALQVVSARPTETTLDLRPYAFGPLLVHALRSADAERPRITDVAYTPATDSATATIRVRVPDDLPAGTYSGLLLEPESSRPAGLLSIRVFEA